MNNAMPAAETLECQIVRESPKAYFVNIAGCTESVWLPKSQLLGARLSEEDYGDGSKPGRYLYCELPTWLWNKLPRKTCPVPFATRPW